eukprot:scaffold26224_cov63-Attheya_sp.AAC.3
MKEATIMYQNEQDVAKEAVAQNLQENDRTIYIAELVNAKNDTNIQDPTIRKEVSEGNAGLSLERQGPKGMIGSRYHYKALCGAFESYVKLKQVTRDSNLKQTFLQKLVNVVVNKHPNKNQTGRILFERLQKSVVATLGIGKVGKIKERHNKWMTYSNVNIWFFSFKKNLIEEGLAVENDLEDDYPGELLYGEGQIEQLGNINETGMVMDTTKSQKGGRESVVFFDPLILDGPEMLVHKNSFSGTLMQGCTAGK